MELVELVERLNTRQESFSFSVGECRLVLDEIQESAERIYQGDVLLEKRGQNTARLAKTKLLVLLKRLKQGGEKNISNMDDKQRTELILKQLSILGSLSGLVVASSSSQGRSSMLNKVLTLFA